MEFYTQEVEENNGMNMEFKDFGPMSGSTCVFKKCCKKYKKKGKKHCKSCPKV